MSIATNAKCYQGEMEKDAQVRYVKEKDSERGAEYEHLERAAVLPGSLPVLILSYSEGIGTGGFGNILNRTDQNLIGHCTKTGLMSYFFPLSPSKNFLNSSRSSVIRHFGIDLKNHLP